MRLVKLSSDRFVVISEIDDLYTVGTKEQIEYLLIDLIKIPDGDVLMAFEELEKNGHNMADFGVAYRFIFTSNTEPLAA